MNFESLCRTPQRDYTTEDCHFSPKDLAQESILRGLEKLSERGSRIADAGTTTEFIDLYKDDGGLFVTIYGYAQKEAYRERFGSENAPHKQEFLRRMTYVGEMFNEDYRLSQNDPRLNDIESREALERLLDSVPHKHRKDILFFIGVWQTMDQGYNVSKVALNRVSRIRKKTGLPLLLPRGRRKTEVSQAAPTYAN